ncbi:hypothetical protein BOX15_Mlig025744g1, partial [Macrostomum lignano]
FMWPKRLRQSSSQRPKTTATPHAPPAKLSVNSRLNQLRYYGNQMTALDALRNELRQFAVRLKVEAVSLSDMQRAAGLDGSVGDLDDKDAATVGFSSAGSGISGEYTAGRGSAAAAAAVSAGTRASSSSCSGACWDDARSFATTAAAASIADTTTRTQTRAQLMTRKMRRLTSTRTLLIMYPASWMRSLMAATSRTRGVTSRLTLRSTPCTSCSALASRFGISFV